MGRKCAQLIREKKSYLRVLTALAASLKMHRRMKKMMKNPLREEVLQVNIHTDIERKQ